MLLICVGGGLPPIAISIYTILVRYRTCGEGLTRIYLTLRGQNVGGAVRRFDLPPMAASGPARMLDQIEYISVSAVTAT